MYGPCYLYSFLSSPAHRPSLPCRRLPTHARCPPIAHVGYHRIESCHIPLLASHRPLYTSPCPSPPPSPHSPTHRLITLSAHTPRPRPRLPPRTDYTHTVSSSRVEIFPPIVHVQFDRSQSGVMCAILEPSKLPARRGVPPGARATCEYCRRGRRTDARASLEAAPPGAVSFEDSESVFEGFNIQRRGRRRRKCARAGARGACVPPNIFQLRRTLARARVRVRSRGPAPADIRRSTFSISIFNIKRDRAVRRGRVDLRAPSGSIARHGGELATRSDLASFPRDAPCLDG